MNMEDEQVEWFIANGLDVEDCTESELQVARWALGAGFPSGFQKGYDTGHDHGYNERANEADPDHDCC